MMSTRGAKLLKHLKSYDVIGFDLDNTLVRYKLNYLYEFLFKSQANFLVKHRKCSHSLFDRFESQKHFLHKGLVLDISHGNLLKLDAEGKIAMATHGSRLMSKEEVRRCYADDRPAFHADIVKSYNSTRDFRIFENAFDIPSALLCALLVDDVDARSNKHGDKVTVECYREVWRDVLASLIFLFDKKYFELKDSDYFPAVRSQPELFIDQVKPSFVELLRCLKAEGKFLFLLTSSYVDYAEFLLDHVFGPDAWQDLFDVSIYFARKPTFFSDDHPFFAVRRREVVAEPASLARGKFSHGCLRQLDAFFEQVTAPRAPRVVYFGDSVRSDVAPVGLYSAWRPWCVIEELPEQAAEAAHSYWPSESAPWGSIFSCSHGEADSLWYSVVKKYCPHPSIQVMEDLCDS